MSQFSKYLQPQQLTFTSIGGGVRTYVVSMLNNNICRFYILGSTTTTATNNKTITLSAGDKTILFDCANYDYVTGFTLNSLAAVKGTFDCSMFNNLLILSLYQNSFLTEIINPTQSLNSNTFNTYQAYDCDLTGNLDVSGLNKLGGVFNVQSNNKLTSITNPISNQIFTSYRADACNLTGNLNLSGLTGLGGWLRVNSNPNLTSITNPTSSQIFTTYYAYLCNLTGNLNLSILSGLGGDVRVYSNPNLTGITNPTSSQVFTYYYAHSCNLTGNLDVSGLSGLGGQFNCYSNPNLTGITNPTNTKTFASYYAYSCNIPFINFTGLTQITKINNSKVYIQDNAMTVDNVNHILFDLNIISASGYTGRVINISGTNAAPDGSGGGYDGITAKNNLITKGFTVTTT